jgi:hypothetical protein
MKKFKSLTAVLTTILLTAAMAMSEELNTRAFTEGHK